MVKDNLPQTTMKDDFRFVVENDSQQLVTIKNKGNISLKLLDITAGPTSNFGFFGVTIVDDISTPYNEGTSVLQSSIITWTEKNIKTPLSSGKYVILYTSAIDSSRTKYVISVKAHS